MGKNFSNWFINLAINSSMVHVGKLFSLRILFKEIVGWSLFTLNPTPLKLKILLAKKVEKN
jgi:hypothetical protein